MYENFTDNAKRLMQFAIQAAHEFNHEYVGTEHLLKALLSLEEGKAVEVLANLKLDCAEILEVLSSHIQAKLEIYFAEHLPLTPRAIRVLQFAEREALNHGCSEIDTGHILLGLIMDDGGQAWEVLNHHKVKLSIEEVRSKMHEVQIKEENKNISPSVVYIR